MHPVLRIGATVSALMLLAVMTACSEEPIEAGETSLKPVAERNQAPDFTLTDADGKSVTLSDFRGQVVLLNFWATWCAPCKIEIPWFMEFERKLSERGLAVVGVSLDEGGWDDVRPYIERVKPGYRILMGTEEVAMLYGGVEALPTTFLIDRDGKIGSVHIGLTISKNGYESEINELLNDTAAADASAAVLTASAGGGAD